MTASSKQRSVLQIVFFTVFIDLVGFGIIIPIQPFLAEAFGASPALVTLLGAAYSAMQFLFAPFWGRLSDRVGRRPVMLSSIALGTLGYLLFGLAGSFPWLLGARMLAGFGNANIGAAQAIIADATSPTERAKGMGLIGAAFGLGFIFGPALGGFFSQFGLAVPAYIAAGLSLLNFLLAFARLPETHRNPGAHSGKSGPLIGFSLEDLRKASALANVKHVLLVFFLATAGFSLMEQVLGLYVEKNWLPVGGVDHAKEAARLTTYILVVVGMTATIVQGGLIGGFVKRFGERKLLAMGPFVNSLSFLLIVAAGSLKMYSLMLVMGVLTAFGTGITNPSLSSILSQLVDERDRGMVLGLGQSFGALGRVFGPAISGTLFQMLPAMPFLTGSVMMLGCAFVAFLLPVNVGRPRDEVKASTSGSFGH